MSMCARECGRKVVRDTRGEKKENSWHKALRFPKDKDLSFPKLLFSPCSNEYF